MATAIAAAPDGTVYVVDRQGPSLRAYSRDGEYLRDLARAGEGPGELKRPDGGLSILPDGRILVRDPGNARITVFRPDGEYETEWRIRGQSYTGTPLYIDRAGGAYQQLLDFGGGELRFSLVRYGPDGEPGDTIRIPAADDAPRLVAEGPDGNSQDFDRVPFWPSEPTTLSPDGQLVIGRSGAYSIDVPKDGGMLRIERAYEPVPVLPDERANLRERVTHGMRRTEPGWDWDGPSIPSHKPAFSSLMFDADGRLWVSVHAEAERIPDDQIEPRESGADEAPPLRWREPLRFDLFEVDGTYLGEVEMPLGFGTRPRPVIMGETVWAILQDRLDVPYLVRFRIVPEGDLP